MTETEITFEKIVRQLDPQKRENLAADIAKVRGTLADPAADVMRQCGDNIWGDCKQFSKDDWRNEVENNETVLGYWAWVVHQAEADEVSLSSLTAPGGSAERDSLSVTAYGYYINLDERGSFYADVRDGDGNSIFEIRDGDSLQEDESSIFEDGYMRNKQDLEGLTAHLIDLGLVHKESRILASNDFEELENTATEAPRG